MWNDLQNNYIRGESMKFIKQHLTVEDVRTLTETQIKNFHNRVYWGDPEHGDIFCDFRSGGVHVVREIRQEPNACFLVYDGGETSNWDYCFPLLNAAQLLDLLSLETDIEVRCFGNGWLAIFEDKTLRTEDRDGLVDLLFDCLKLKLS